MPHLSPMKWCMMLISFWLLMTVLTSINWWSQPQMWNNMNMMSKSSLTHSWHW